MKSKYVPVVGDFVVFNDLDDAALFVVKQIEGVNRRIATVINACNVHLNPLPQSLDISLCQKPNEKQLKAFRDMTAPVNPYKRINITPKLSELDQLLDEDSEYNKGVAREMELAESAPALLEALKNLLVRDGDRYVVAVKQDMPVNRLLSLHVWNLLNKEIDGQGI